MGLKFYVWLITILQFVNKLRYAKEGAKDIMDRTCANLPWEVKLEVDGHEIEIPEVKLHSCFLAIPYYLL